MFEAELAALQGIYDFVISLPNVLADIAGALLLSAVYPLVVVISTVNYLWNMIYLVFANFINAVFSIPNSIITLVNILFVGVFPSVWVAILISTILVIASFRVYSFLKDIEIVGNKI